MLNLCNSFGHNFSLVRYSDMNLAVSSAVPESVESAGEDLHICGTCKSRFGSIEEFVSHKKQNCGSQTSSEEHSAVVLETCKLELVENNDTTVNPSSLLNVHREFSPLSDESSSTTNAASSDLPDSNDKAKEMDSHKLKLLISHPTCHASTRDNNTNKSATNNSGIGDKNLQRKKKFKCSHDGCSYSSAYPKDLQRHLRVHTGERPFLCDICNKTFNRPDKLKVHLRHHTGVKPYKCTECDYATGDSSSLKKHLRIHTDERPFRCQICQYASRNSSQLVVHLRTHTGDAPFQCPHCPNKFKINSDLKRHMRLHTGEKPYLCNFCDYRCAIKGNLKTHIRLNHSTENLQKCNLCDFTSPSRKVLKQHEKSHLVKSIQCSYPQCNYSCKSQASLLNHARTHSDDRPFKCDYCPYASRQRGNVRTHIRKRHPEKLPRSRKLTTKKKPALGLNSDGPILASGQGNQTGSTDSQAGNATVRRSTRSRPLCVQSHKCHLCDSAFVREDSLRSHIRQHQKMDQPPAQGGPEVEVDEGSDMLTSPNKEPLPVVSSVTTAGHQDPVESGLVQQVVDEGCVLNIELSEKGDHRGQVIEEALRQSGVICVPSLSLDGTAANSIPTGVASGNATDVASSQTPASYFIGDGTIETPDVITTVAQCHTSEELHCGVSQTTASLADSGAILVNAANLEIPLTSVASTAMVGTPQLLYLRLVPYTASTSVQQVLHGAPSGCTQILLNADDGEALRFQDAGVLQTHFESLTDHAQGLNHQLINYIVSGESGGDASASLVTSMDGSVSGPVLLDASLKAAPTSTILQTTQVSLLPSSHYEVSAPLSESTVQCSAVQISPEGRTLSTLMPVSISSSEVPVAEILGDTW